MLRTGIVEVPPADEQTPAETQAGSAELAMVAPVTVLRFPAFAEATAMQALEDVIRDHPDLDRPAGPGAVRPLLDALDTLVTAAYDAPEAPFDLAGPDSQLGHEYIHPIKTAELCIILAQAGGVSRAEVHPLAAAAALMDIGYAALRRSLLDEPRGLEEHEWRQQVERHPSYSVRILSGAGLGDVAMEAVAQHHERWDGGGTLGLKAAQISPFARIIAIADAYVALRSRQAYRNALAHTDAVDVIERDAGGAFDPDLVRAFVDAVAALVPALAGTATLSGNVVASRTDEDLSQSRGRREQPHDESTAAPVRREDVAPAEDSPQRAGGKRAAPRPPRPAALATVMETARTRASASAEGARRVRRPASSAVVTTMPPRRATRTTAASLWTPRFYLRMRM